jgi:hypothetical protein
MPVITIGIVAIVTKWLAAHGVIAGAAVHPAPVAAAGHAIGAGHVAATGTALAGHAGLHLTSAVVLGTTISASTFGGITFISLYNNLLNDAYKRAKHGTRAMPTRDELRQIADAAYRAARAELERKGFLTPAYDADISRIYHAIA